MRPYFLVDGLHISAYTRIITGTHCFGRASVPVLAAARLHRTPANLYCPIPYSARSVASQSGHLRHHQHTLGSLCPPVTMPSETLRNRHEGDLLTGLLQHLTILLSGTVIAHGSALNDLSVVLSLLCPLRNITS